MELSNIIIKTRQHLIETHTNTTHTCSYVKIKFCLQNKELRSPYFAYASVDSLPSKKKIPILTIVQILINENKLAKISNRVQVTLKPQIIHSLLRGIQFKHIFIMKTENKTRTPFRQTKPLLVLSYPTLMVSRMISFTLLSHYFKHRCKAF